MNNILKINNTNIINFGKYSAEIANEFYHQFIELYLNSLEIGGYFGYENEYVTIKPGDNVIDCGANMGLFSNWAASKGAMVYGFEPGKTAYSLNKENRKLYLNNIITYPYAVGKKNEIIDYIECLNIGGSHLAKYIINNQAGFRDQYMVKSISLDTFFIHTKIDFIKIDCEGAEADILLGAKNIINNYSPKIVMASYHSVGDNKKLKDILLSINLKYNIVEDREKLFCWV